MRKPKKTAIRMNVFTQVTELDRWWRENLIEEQPPKPVT